MIVSIKGILSSKKTSDVVIDVNGIGYKCSISAYTYDHLPNIGEEVLSKAILAPFQKILDNGGLESTTIPSKQGVGIDVVTGNMVHMIDEGIIDPLLVTKSALRNAASVASTIISTDCVINNVRVDESSR